MKTLRLLFLIAGCGLQVSAQAATLTVGASGEDYRTISAALAACGAGDVIRVSAGTYSAAGGEVFPLRLETAITLEWATNGLQPHLQGDGLHTVVSISTGGVTVRGFRISGGVGSEGINLMDGGGICVFVGPDETDNVVIEDCLIENNSCIADETYDGCGGGVYCGGTYCECFQIHIRGCTIRNNAVPGNGAGVCCALLSIVHLENTLILDNTAQDNGGGVYVDVYGFAALSEDTRLVRNRSVGDPASPNFGGKGGGLFCESYGFFTMTNCLVAGNSAAYFGGGIFTRAADWVGDDPCFSGGRTPEVATTLLATNWAGMAGGGTYLGGSGTLVFNQSTNYWNDAEQDGGAVFVADGGASRATLRFTDGCLLEGNQCAGRGGGVYLGTNATGQFAATRFLGNSALFEGGAVFQQAKSSALLTNCLLTYNNSARAHGGGCYLASMATNELQRSTVVGNFAPFGQSGICLSTNSAFTARDSILWRNAGGSIETNGAKLQVAFTLNDDLDPLFVGWGAKSDLYFNATVVGPGSGTAADPYRDLQVGLDGFDFRLAATSPCVGAASDGGNMGAVTGLGGAPGSIVATINLARGTYDIRGRNIMFTRGLQGNGLANSTIRNAVFGYVEDTYVRDLSISGERWFGGIVIRANANFERSAVASNRVLTDGGGVYVATGRCIMSNSSVSANQSVVHGGGLFLARNTTLTMDASQILANSNVAPGPGNGGGLYGSAGAGLWVTNNCLIDGNSTPNEGGGVYLEADTTATVAGSQVSKNTANGGAGIYELGALWVTDSLMFANQASLNAGALHLGANANGTLERAIISSNTAASSGGGILCYGAALISSCQFWTNQAAYAGALQVQNNPDLRPVLCEDTHFVRNHANNIGGAVRCWVGTAPVFERCEFLNNSANHGGAGSLWTGSRAVFANCGFQGNRASGRGGALYSRAAATSLRLCDFSANSAGSDGGGADLWAGDTSAFDQCTFSGETSGGNGGALSIRDTAAPSFRDVQISRCRAAANGGAIGCRNQAAPRFDDVSVSDSMAVLGGGVFADGTTIGTFQRCHFLSNVATNSVGSPDGGGANFTGAASGRFACCAFEGNRALDDGGALSVSGTGAGVALTNCFLVNNQAVNSGGGAHFTLMGSGVFQNCTIVSNRVQVSNGGGIYRETNCPVTLDSSILYGNDPDGMAQSGGGVSVIYSCTQESWSGTGNTTDDPLLHPLNSSLLEDSPCIDAGHPSPARNDACRPPGKGTDRNDMGASGGPGNCCQATPKVLLHRYSFEIDASDSVGTAHGQLINNPTVSGGAVHLNGNSQFVNLPPSLLKGLTSVTFEFWASFGANGDNARVFDFGDRTGTSGNTYICFTPHGGGKHMLVVRNASGLRRSLELSGTLDGASHVHVACVVDPPTSTLMLYVDGMPVAWGTDLSFPLSEINNLYSWLGRSLFASNAYLNGSIDEFRLYNFALSPAEVWESCLQGPDAPLPPDSDGPTLVLSSDPAGVRLTWPDASFPWDIVWNLYATTDLTKPSWTRVTNGVVHGGGQVTVTLPLDGPQGYFRIQSP